MHDAFIDLNRERAAENGREIVSTG